MSEKCAHSITEPAAENSEEEATERRSTELDLTTNDNDPSMYQWTSSQNSISQRKRKLPLLHQRHRMRKLRYNLLLGRCTSIPPLNEDFRNSEDLHQYLKYLNDNYEEHSTWLKYPSTPALPASQKPPHVNVPALDTGLYALRKYNAMFGTNHIVPTLREDQSVVPQRAYKTRNAWYCARRSNAGAVAGVRQGE